MLILSSACFICLLFQRVYESTTLLAMLAGSLPLKSNGGGVEGGGGEGEGRV